MSENKTTTRTYMYGEPTAPVSILVPESKKPEILAKFYKILEEYHNPKVVEVEIISKPKQLKPLNDVKKNIDRMEEEVVSTRLDKINVGIPVLALPKGSKRIEPGLYSGEGKFFTNKIVDNVLQILEWKDEEAARTYLINLRK